MNNESGILASHNLSTDETENKARLLDKGNEALDRDDYKLALECFHKVTVIDGADAEGWNLLGVSFSNLDFSKEAWRSYMLALAVDPENVAALWYSAEFLITMEDFELARLMLSRYIELEDDEERLAEANEELAEVTRQLGDRSTKKPSLDLSSDEETDGVASDDDQDEEDLPDGFAIDSDDDEFGSEEYEDEEDGYDENIDSMSEEEEEKFIASVTLQLTGMNAACGACSTPVPTDAPYCYSCKSICFYEDV